MNIDAKKYHCIAIIVGLTAKKLYKIGAGKIMTNETEISLEEIKTILSNYKGLKKQIRKHISDLYDDLMDTDNLIETVSIKKNRNI